MAEADIITLDSDEEDNATSSSHQYMTNGNNGAGVTIKRIPTAPKVIPRGIAGPSGLPLQPRKPQVPKKPGVIPPFALFSQEKRNEILNEQPNISFGEVGRKMGELWHALSEDEKEDYRRRAREVSDKKMADYQESLRKMPPQQRQLAISQANQPQKRRKTHGYAIFSAEMRKNLGNAMSPQETANVIAESWRSASPAVRRDYEDRAARVNAVQQRRVQPPMAQPRPQMTQAFPNQFNNSSNSGLRISSVSSLSPQAKKRPPMPNRTLTAPGPRLPSGISITRVEPEVSIVDEQPAHLPPPVVKNHLSNRGRGSIRRPALSPAAQAAMRVKAQLRNQQQISSQSVAGNGRGMINPRGRPYLNSQGAPMYRMVGPGMKRMAPRGAGMIGQGPAKVPRMNAPRIEQKLCRSCGMVGPVGCKLAERPEILQSLSELTLTSIDLVKDQLEGYPAEICRRCLTSISNYTVFKKTFCDGQEKLKARVQPTLLPLPADLAAAVNTADPSSPSASTGQEESILPDLDLDMDFGENPANIPQPVSIKEERIRVITPSMEKIRIKTEVSKPMNSDNIVEDGTEEKLVTKTEANSETKENGSDNKDAIKTEAEITKNEENEDIKEDAKKDNDKPELSKKLSTKDDDDPLLQASSSKIEESDGVDPLNCIVESTDTFAENESSDNFVSNEEEAMLSNKSDEPMEQNSKSPPDNENGMASEHEDSSQLVSEEDSNQNCKDDKNEANPNDVNALNALAEEDGDGVNETYANDTDANIVAGEESTDTFAENESSDNFVSNEEETMVSNNDTLGEPFEATTDENSIATGDNENESFVSCNNEADQTVTNSLSDGDPFQSFVTSQENDSQLEEAAEESANPNDDDNNDAFTPRENDEDEV